MITSKDLPPKFVKFLEANNALEKFLYNRNNIGSRDSKMYKDDLSIAPHEAINIAFSWSITNEGGEFWSKLDDMWRKKYINYQKTNNKTNYL